MIHESGFLLDSYSHIGLVRFSELWCVDPLSSDYSVHLDWCAHYNVAKSRTLIRTTAQNYLRKRPL